MAPHAVSLILLFIFVSSHLTTTAPTAAAEPDDYLKAVCNMTRYPALCVHSLAPFSRAGSRSPSRERPLLWARAAVSVTIDETERVRGYLTSAAGGLRRWKRQRQRQRQRREVVPGALRDCIECFGDAVVELHGSLAELRRLRESTFQWQMSNVQTWVTAAQTDQETCLDELEEEAAAAARAKERRVVAFLKSMVLNTTYLSSNALALVNNLASSGGIN